MIDLKDRLDLAMGIADSLKASDSLSVNTIYDLCLHISKAQELVENLTIPVVSQQSELLKAFLSELEEVKSDGATITDEDAFIAQFIK